MTRSFWFLSIMLLGQMGLSQPQNQLDLLIEKRTVGRLKIGMSVDEVYAIYGRENTLLFDQFLEGTYSPALAISNNKGSNILNAELLCDKVERIVILSSEFRTREGCGIGSTYSELLQKHSVESVVIGETGVFAVVKDLQLSFRLSLQVSNTGSVDSKKIDPLTSIDMILAY